MGHICSSRDEIMVHRILNLLIPLLNGHHSLPGCLSEDTPVTTPGTYSMKPRWTPPRYQSGISAGDSKVVNGVPYPSKCQRSFRLHLPALQLLAILSSTESTKSRTLPALKWLLPLAVVYCEGVSNTLASVRSIATMLHLNSFLLALPLLPSSGVMSNPVTLALQ